MPIRNDLPMSGRKDRKNAGFYRRLCVMLTILLAAAAAIASAAVSSRIRLENSLAYIRQENEALRLQVEELQTGLELKERNLLETEAELAASESENEALTGELETSQLEADALRIEARLDVALLSAGTVLRADQIDMTAVEHYFKSVPIEVGDAVYERIYGKSYVENPDVDLEDLRYLKLLHYNFDHEIQVGELIVAAELESDYLEIFTELFRNGYEICSMYLIDNYWTGDGEESDTASIEENNTSAFCYRPITGGGRLSNHALGRAIDINPQQNPYVSYSGGSPYWFHDNADDYIDRETGLDHMITHEDLCYQLFTEHGFEWGGDWDTVKDYQHFEKE